MFGSKAKNNHPESSDEAGHHPEAKRLRDERDPGDAEARVAELESQLDEAVNNYKRALADYQNYQRRAIASEAEARRQGVTSVLHSVIPVLDHFDLAMQQEVSKDDRGIMEGVKVIRAELLRALENHGVSLIRPDLNEVFDPNSHEAIMQQPAPGVEPGRIAATLQAGYRLGDRVIRSAKVAVAPAEQNYD